MDLITQLFAAITAAFTKNDQKLNKLNADKEAKINKTQDLVGGSANYPSVPAVNTGLTATENAAKNYTDQEVATRIPLSQKGTANGVAETDANNIILSQHMPSYVDDVIEGTLVNNTTFNDVNGNPVTPEAGKIYVDTSANISYRWSGTIYAEIGQGLALGETANTAYRGDRGKIAYDHSQVTSGNPHNVTKGQVGLGNVNNTSDMAKPVSTAQQAAIDAVQADANAAQADANTAQNTADAAQTDATAAQNAANAAQADATAAQNDIDTYQTEMGDPNTAIPNWALQIENEVNF